MTAATIAAVVGHPLELFKDSCWLREESRPVSYLSGDLQPYEQLEDRWRLLPPVAGDYAMVMTTGGVSKPFTVHAVDVAVSPPSKSVIFLGDSGTAADNGSGFPAQTKALVGAACTLLGTQGTTYPHEGHPGETNVWFATSTESPLTNGTTSLDIAHYLGLLTGTPDAIIESNGSNDVFSSIGNPTAIEAAITASFAARDAIRAAFRALLPDLQFYYATIWPGNYREAAWTSNYEFSPRPTGWLFREAHERIVVRNYETYAGRETEGIHIVPTHLSISRLHDYPVDNAFHFTLSDGHARTSRNAFWPALNAYLFT